MYTVFIRTCLAIVLLIRSFVLPSSRCRHRRGLLKVPNACVTRTSLVKQGKEVKRRNKSS